MSIRQDIWNLVRSRAGEWVTRDDLNFIGGEDTGRRLRELEEDVAASGEWRMETRRDAKKRNEVRLMPIIPDAPKPEGVWRCVKCRSVAIGVTMASIDPRWRIGHCGHCKNHEATYQRAEW